MFLDHKNIERAEAVLKSRRASKKLTNWVADTQDILSNVVRVWIDGKHNVIADVGSRITWEGSLAKHLPVPEYPILDFIRRLFTHPSQVEQQVAQRHR